MSLPPCPAPAATNRKRQLLGGVRTRKEDAPFTAHWEFRLGNHEAAIEDFNAALKNASGELEFSRRIRRDIRYNKANSQYALGQFETAFDDFEGAGGKARSNTCLGMGNSKLMQAQFEDAREIYRLGRDVEPEKAAADCDANASMAEQLIAALAGEQFKSSIVGNNLVIETKKAGGETYRFTGNTGNMGNWGGGPGYGGLSGFAVTLKKPDAGHL